MAATTFATPPREFRRTPLGPSSIHNATPSLTKPSQDSLVAFGRRPARNGSPPSATAQQTVSDPPSWGLMSAGSAPQQRSSTSGQQGFVTGSNPAFLSSRSMGLGRRYRGVVVYYTTTKGFGFAHTEKPEVWKIYVHIYALEKCGVADLEVGMELEFNVRENHKGKYACNVCPVARDAAGHVIERECPVAIPMLEGRHVGTLKSFDSQRLFGWVMCGETEVFMTIYELRQDNMEQHLVPGTVLEFSIGKHGRGPTAYDIDVLQTARPMMGSMGSMFTPMATTAPPAQQLSTTTTPLAVPMLPSLLSTVASPQPTLADANFAATLGSVAALLQSQANVGSQQLTQDQLNTLIAATMMNQQLQQLASLSNPFGSLFNLSQGPAPTPSLASGQDAVGGGQVARASEPLLKLPSMSTHSPLLGRASSWDEATAPTDRPSTMDDDEAVPLNTAAWTSALLL